MYSGRKISYCEPKKKFYILGFIIILVALLMLFPEFTGWAVDVLKLSIGISPKEKACMYFISVPDNITQYGESSFYILMENCGSLVLNGTIVSEIKNSSMDTVDTIYSSSYSLESSKEIGFNFSWTASYPLGVYTIFARDDIRNETTEINTSFSIVCSVGSYRCFGNTIMFCQDPLNWTFIKKCEYMCINGSCIPFPPGPSEQGGGGGGGPVLLTASMELEYPHNINIQKGTNITFFIKVSNNGTSVLHNIYLMLTSDNPGVVIPEITVPVLEQNSSTVFAVTIESMKAQVGEYEISFLVLSDETYKKGTVVVNISSTEEIDYQSLIDYYFSLIDYLEKEIRDAELKGKNVTLARKSFLDVIDEFEAAKRLFDMKLYPEFLKQIEVVRSKIVECVVYLAKAKPEPLRVIVTFPDYKTFLYIIAVVVMAAFVAVFVLKKVNEWRRRRELIMPRRWGF